MRLLRGWFAVPLWKRVVAGLVLGALLGALSPDGAAAIKLVGDLFVRLIKMLVVPVVLVTIAAGSPRSAIHAGSGRSADVPSGCSR